MMTVNFDPVIMKIGPFAVHWYGLMYILGFIASYMITTRLVKKRNINLSNDDIMSFYTYMVLGVVLGGRLGYVLIYGLKDYLQNPKDIIAIWQGGMSFHGGIIGTALAGWIFCRKYKQDYRVMADIMALGAPIGLGLGRLGNFINGELYGRITQVSWGMIFPGAGPEPRHPSQLYELFLEGICLLILLWIFKNRLEKYAGKLFSLFIMGYSVSRFIVEFFREPDAQLGLLSMNLSMGQWLSILMFIAGGCLWKFWAAANPPATSPSR